MGVDTEGLLNKDISVLEVKSVIEELIQGEVILYSNANNYYTLSFDYKDERRNLSLFEQYPSEDLNNEIVTLIMLSKYGHANEIIKSIVSYFGGLYIENDCSGEEPVYLEKTSSYVENSSMKADKEFLKLMEVYDLSFNEKIKFIKFIKENNKKINELISKL